MSVVFCTGLIGGGNSPKRVSNTVATDSHNVFLSRPHLDTKGVLRAVVLKQNRLLLTGLAVQFDGFDTPADVVRILDHDLVVGGAETVAQREAAPLRGYGTDRWDADLVKALRDCCLSQPGVKRCGVSHLQRRSDRWRQLAETSLQHGAY